MINDFKSAVDAANAEMTDPEQHRVVAAGSDQTPRFEVYHAPFSVCSHKVRAVLLEKQIPFISHEMKMNLVAHDAPCPDNYKPGYVRLRLRAGDSHALANGFTGQSSVASQGLDPCVVPTLVDHKKRRVIVDSARICAYLDNETSSPDLVPSDLAGAMDGEIALIDEAPHVGILYGAHPDTDKRPSVIVQGLTGVHDRKLTHLKGLVAEHRDAPDLQRAYAAKIAKEEHAKGFIKSASSMADAHMRMRAHVAALEQNLERHAKPWAMGDGYTMADIFWSVSLFRLKWIGLGSLWENGASSLVTAYVERAFARKSFQDAVVNWPRSTPPTPHIEDTATYAQHLHTAWRAMGLRHAS
ncbi:MAG: glutathione S-transferase family protein [Pseudomonadota bacterium]